MKKLVLLLVIVIILMGCELSVVDTSDQLTISVASSLKNVMLDLQNMYDQNFIINFGSSGNLKTQIQQGASIDIFISASSKEMNELESQGLLLNDTKRDLLQNTLVLITPVGKASEITSFLDVATNKVGQIALGEPSSVPAGQYAQKVFESFGINDKVANKAIYAKDVIQVLTYVAQNEVDAGVVYMTDAKKNKKVTIVDNSDIPVVYPLAIIKDSRHITKAEEFIEFLFSEKAKLIFEKYGFHFK